MKEKGLTSQIVLKELEKKKFLEIPAICIDCMLEVEHDVLEIYTNAFFKVEQVEDNLYSLIILL